MTTDEDRATDARATDARATDARAMHALADRAFTLAAFETDESEKHLAIALARALRFFALRAQGEMS